MWLFIDSDQIFEEDQYCQGGGVGDVVQDLYDLQILRGVY